MTPRRPLRLPSFLAAAMMLAVWIALDPPANAGPRVAPSRVDDLSATPLKSWAPDISRTVAIGGTVFFTTADEEHGTELWKSNGTSAGTVLVKDIFPGSESGTPGSLTEAGGRLFFNADDGVHGWELWASNGTAAGTTLVDDIIPGSLGAYPRVLAEVGSELYFAANEPGYSWALWRSDGTPGGSLRVMSFCEEGCEREPRWIVDGGGAAYFVADDGMSGQELWRSDGTEAGTGMVLDIRPGPESAFSGSEPRPVFVGGALFFVADDGSGPALWKTDGTAAGSVSLAPALASGDLGVLGSRVFFASNVPEGSTDLWATDGTAPGTAKVQDVCASACAAVPLFFFIELRGNLHFVTNDGVHGDEWWRTDGTAAGTTLVADIAPGSKNGTRRPPTGGQTWAWAARFGSAIYFSGNEGSLGLELWRTDGTAAGTWQVKDVAVGSRASGPVEFAAASDELLFLADNGMEGLELWRTDGTFVGTRMVAPRAPRSSLPLPSLSIGGQLLFSADDGVHGRELWGVQPGRTPALVKDINPGGGWSNPSEAVSFLGEAFFVASGPQGWGLWRSDGTAAGTQFVKVGGYMFRPDPGHRIVAGGTLYLTAYGPSGNHLWRSDGTADGTQEVANVGDWTYTGPLHNANGRLFFASTTATYGTELWTSDGTSAGTRLVKDIAPGSAGSWPLFMATVGELAYFTVISGEDGSGCYVTDGTEAGTLPLTDASGNRLSAYAFQELNGRLYLLAYAAAEYGGELYVVTPGSTTAELVADTCPGPCSGLRYETQFAVMAGELYFAATDDVHGYELWRSDGTAGGTFMVADLDGTPASSAPNQLAPLGNRLYFRAFDESHGTELWVSDGTAEGTGLTSDVNPGRGSSNIDVPVALGPWLYFGAFKPGAGTELFRIVAAQAAISEQQAANVTATTATLRATVDSQGVATTAFFEWGQTEGYGRLTGSVAVSASGSSVVNSPITGLSCDTTYHFRTVARNEAWETVGADETFTTPACPPPHFSAASYRASEGAALVTITVRRPAPLSGAITVAYATSGGTATAGVDYLATSGTLTFAAGQATRTFTVKPVNDALAEPQETVLLVLTRADGGDLGEPSTAILTLADNDLAGTVQMAAAAYTVKERAALATITVVRAGGAAGGVTVDYTTNDGSASVGDSDYAATSGTLSFAAGQMSQAFVVAVNDDGRGEGNETVALALSNPTGGALVGRSTATLTIVDDDRYFQLSAPTLSVPEGAAALVTIRRVNSTGAGETISYATADDSAHAGSDYVAAGGTLTFGVGVLSRTVAVLTTRNTLSEGNRSFTVALTGGSLDRGAPTTAVITIVDNDPGGAIEFGAASYTASEKNGLATITVRRSGGVASDVTVDWAASGGTALPGDDYTTTSGTVSFAAGQISRTFSIPIVNDALGEGPETALLKLANAAGGAAVGARSTTTLNLVDDDAHVQLSATAYSVREGGVGRITVRRANSVAAGVGVAYATADGTAVAGTDYLPASGVLTFGAGQLTQAFSVQTLANTSSDAPRTISVQLAEVPGGLDVGLPGGATLTVLDDDSGGVIQFATATVSVPEATRSLAVTLTRSGSTLRDTYVSVAITGGTAAAGEDYQPVGGLVFFGEGTSRTFSVPILDDTQDEGPETIVVTLSDPLPAPGTTLGARSALTITILDNDEAGNVQLTATDYAAREAGGGATITVTRSGGTAGNALVDFVTTDGTAVAGVDYTAISGTLTFGAGETSRTVAVPLLDDGASEPDETVQVLLSDTGGGLTLGARSSATLWIVNDD